MARYTSIKYDIAFKRVFTKPHILKAFLNTVLKEIIPYPIVEIEFQPTDFIAKGENRHVITGVKHTVIDLFCIDEKGRRILVELQKGSSLTAIPRFVDYQCRNYSSQFQTGDKYDQVAPCYSICWFFEINPKHNALLEQITFCSSEKDSQWLLDWQIIALYPKNLNWERLEKAGTQAQLEEWLLLDVVTDLERAKKLKNLIQDTSVSEAFEQLDLSAYTEQQLRAMEFEIISQDYQQQLEERDQKLMEKAEKEKAKALAEKEAENAKALAEKEAENAKALAEKEAENAKALAEKELEMKRTLAQSLLGILDITTISKKTGLSIEEIKSLK